MSERHPPDKLDVLQKYWVEAEEECGRLRARVAELEAERKRLQCLLQASESLKGGYLDCMAELEVVLTDIRDAKEPKDDRAADDADWRYCALEMKRIAALALAKGRAAMCDAYALEHQQFSDRMAELEAENKQLHRQLWIVGGIEPPIELRKEWDREEH